MKQASSTTPQASTERVKTGPERLTALLIRLGPTFVKVGQLLALRPDILPEEYCEALLRLTDRAPPSPWPEIKEILRQDLGAEPEVVFAQISEECHAAGSLAQVHRATTHEGVKVAVKIQRPNLDKQVATDLKRIRWLAHFVKASGINPLISPHELTNELEAWLKQELDFSHELRNTERMHELLRGQPQVRVAQCFAKLSSKRVLTSEFLEGLLFSDLIRLVQREEFELIDDLGYNRDTLSERLIDSVLNQIFDLRQFHADLHPGNIIAMPGNVIGFVDFGLTDVLDPVIEEEQTAYLRAIYDNDVPQMYRSVAQIFIPGHETDSEAFRVEFFTETSRWLTRINAEDQDPNGGGRSPLAGYMVALMRLARSHDMRVPAAGLSMYRTLLTSESVAHYLRGGADLRSVGARFFTQLQAKRLIESWGPDQVRMWLVDLHQLARTGPGILQRFLADLAEGRFSINVRSVTPSSERRQASRRARMITLAILSTSLSLLLFLAGQNEDVLGGGVVTALWAVLGVVLIWIAVLWRGLD